MSSQPVSTRRDNIFSQDRESSYYEAKQGRRFVNVHQTMTTSVDASATTSWVATTPTFLAYQATGTNARRYVLSSFRLSQGTTVASAVIHVAIFVDTADRFSSGGTTVANHNVYTDRSTVDGLADNTANYTFKYMPTATAGTARTPGANAGYSCVFHDIITPTITAPTPYSVSLKDGIILGKTGSILVYTWAATAGPKWDTFQFEFIEES